MLERCSFHTHTHTVNVYKIDAVLIDNLCCPSSTQELDRNLKHGGLVNIDLGLTAASNAQVGGHFGVGWGGLKPLVEEFCKVWDNLIP